MKAKASIVSSLGPLGDHVCGGPYIPDGRQAGSYTSPDVNSVPLFHSFHKPYRHTAVLSVGRLIGSFDTVAGGCFPMNPAATESRIAWCQEG